jgi:hypothetical protein
MVRCKESWVLPCMRPYLGDTTYARHFQKSMMLMATVMLLSLVRTI